MGPKVCIVQYNASRFMARVHRSAEALADAGYEVVLIAIKDAETEAFEQREKYVVKRVELKSRKWPRWTRPVRWIEAIWRTWRAARAERAEIYNPRDIYPMFVSWLAARQGGALIVHDSDELNLHRNWPWTGTWWWLILAKAYEGFFMRRADALITSDFGRSDIISQTYGVKPPVVVLNVPPKVDKVEPNLEFREQALKGQKYLLMYTGGLVKNRALLETVDALHELDDCALAYVGFGHFRETIIDHIEAEGLTDRAAVYDAVPYEELLAITAAADVQLVPFEGTCLSYIYGVPNKVFEAMMVGVPVIGSDLHDIAEMINKERAGGIISDVSDPASIAAAVRALLDGDEPLAEIGARARMAAMERYNWETEREKLLEVYRGLPLKAPVPDGVASA